MLQRVLLVALVSAAHVYAGSNAADHVEVDLTRLNEPTEEQVKEVAEWLMDLETTSLNAEKIGVVSIGEYYIGTVKRGRQRVNVFRFGYSWCFDHLNDKERLVYGDQSVVDPIVLEGPKTRVMTSSSNSFDLLRLRQKYHESVGTQVRLPSDKTSVTSFLKRRGVFYPLSATTGTATGIYMGDCFSYSKSEIKMDRLVGVRAFGDVTQAEFEYRPLKEMVYLRVVSFRESLPVQVDDFLGHDMSLPERDPSKKWEADYEELMELHQIVKPKARTFTTWKKKGKLRLPTSIHSMTLTGPNAVELKAQFRWKLNEEVPDSAFALETVGQVGPLTIVSE